MIGDPIIKTSGQAVLVAGGAGYIGSHTCKALAAAGFTPITYDNLVYGHESAVKWGPFEQGDVLDTERITDVIRKYRPEAVLHFAAFAYVGESIAEPAKYYRNNVLGTLSLLDVMRAEGIDRLVFSSSCATYGVPEELPICESAAQNPINPYGASKLMAERILNDYRASYGLKSVALRYFNAAGADPECEIGEDHNPETHLIPLVLDAAIGVRPEITIFGDNYETPDGTCIRDYVHVSDVARAHVLALEKLLNKNLHPAYNLGTGEGTSVKKIIETVRTITGQDFNVMKGPRRTGDPAVLVSDPRRANEELNWKPEYPSIEDMIETAWKWHAQLRGGLKSSDTKLDEKETVAR